MLKKTGKVISGWTLKGSEKNEAIKRELNYFSSFRMDTEVECLCCGERFKLKQATALVPFGKEKKDSIVLCKNYPECDGDIYDFWDNTDVVSYGGFEASIVPMNITEEEMMERIKDLPEAPKDGPIEPGVWYRGSDLN